MNFSCTLAEWVKTKIISVKITIFVTFRIYEILLTMRTLLIVIIAVHTLVDKVKSVLQTPQPERNPEDSSNNSESENDSSLEVPRKYIVPNDSIIGAKLYIQSPPNNSIETHSFMCLGRTGCFGQP